MEEKNENFMMEEKNEEVTAEETMVTEESNEEFAVEETAKGSTSGFKKFLNKKILLPVVAGVCCVGAVVGIILAQGGKNNGDEKDTFTYSFNVMGGTTMSDVALEKGAEYTLPPPADREGYIFEGWYLTETFEGAPVTSVVVEANQTYYAKWVQLAKIVVSIDGNETIVYAKAGQKVYDVLKSHIPSKNGLTFGAWFSNGKAVEDTTVVPQNGLTVTPKFKVAYTVELYKKNPDGTYQEPEIIEGTEYVGEKYTSSQSKVGYTEDTAHANRVVEKVLSEKASDNVFKHYFNPRTYAVTFIANKPNGASAEEIVITKTYGDPIYMPNTYTAEGYCLIGWSRDKNETNPEFKAYAVDALLQNKPNGFTPRESDIFEPNANDFETVMLFGIWAKGYTDMFGGNDHIYLIEEGEGKDAETVAYLSRGNLFFKGEYDSDRNEFYFLDAEGAIILEGKFYENNMFAYYSEKRSAYTAYYYVMGKGLDQSIQIAFDNANGVTYKVKGEADTVGTQTINDDGECIADFTKATSGYMMGKTITFITGTYDNANAFIMLNEAERDMGTLSRFYYNQAQNTISLYPSGVADIKMNGYGVATYTTASGATNYYYTYENGVISLRSQYGGAFGDAIVMTIQGQLGYVLYTKWQDTELKVAGGGTLKMDGGINAVYTNGSKEIKGYYTAEESSLGGYIIRMKSTENQQYTFRVKGKLTDEGELQVGYTVEVKDNAYSEYRYLSEGKVYNAALIVIEDEENMALYGYNKKANSFVQVSSGTYTPVDGEDGYFVYEAVTYNDELDASTLINTPIDPSVIQSFKFALDSETTSYNVFYLEYMTDKNGNETPYVENYTCTTTAVDTSLKLVGGFAYYKLEGVPYSGPYALYEDEGYIVIMSGDATGSKTFYVAIDEANKQFTPLEYQPYTAYLYSVDGEICNKKDKTVSMYFDGKGNATYAENGGEGIVGTIKKTGKEGDYDVYEFNSADRTFKFLLASRSGVKIFIRENTDYASKYETEDAILELNGYGTDGAYVTNNNSYSGQYLIVEENVISLKDSASGKTFYFDINGDSFTVRSEEYGSYMWVENQNWIQQTYFELNGYGKLLVYTLNKSTNERVYIDENGTYTQDGKVFTLVWNDGANELEGELGRYGSSNAFIVKFEEEEKEEGKKVVGLYINENDWSVLILDDIGNAIKYTDEGEKEVGYYTVIADDLLYYVNKANTDACLYVYDIEARTATQVKYSVKTRYLTEDMETLTFYEYGYIISADKQGNQERYFYYKNGGTVEIYVSAPTDENANDYGFVTKTLDDGFTDTLTFVENGKTYFKNDGDSLSFGRVGDSYPILNGGNTFTLGNLIFDASAETEFEANGLIELSAGGNSSKEKCVVLREVNDKGVEKTYIIFSDYRFEVELTFNGMEGDSKYTILGMETYQVAYANSFLNAYAYYAGFGYKIKNTVGEITIHGEFNEDGTEKEILVDATFLEDSGVKDEYGNFIKFTNAAYKVHPEGYYSATFTVENKSAGEGLEKSYTYSVYFVIAPHRQMAAYGFNVVAVTRHQTFTSGEYEILAERVVATELARFEKGDLFNVTVKKNGVDLGGSLVKSEEVIQFVEGKALYVVRTKDGNKYTGATYYDVTLESEPLIDAVDGEEKVPMYKEVSIAKRSTAVTAIYYSIDDKYFADFTENGVGVITLVKETFIGTGTTEVAEADLHVMYKPTDGSTIVESYKVATSSGRYFMVQIRSKDVDGTQVTYLYVQEVLDEV